MKSIPMNDGWMVSQKRGLFDGMGGDAPEAREVTLPHDAMLALPRSADAPSGNLSGYFPGGAVQYTRILPPVGADQVHTLVFDAVYRDAMVFVNDHFAGQNANGYTRFAVPLDPFLHLDAPNEVRVEARAHRDSRWYTGLGIHRNVALVSGPRIHIALDGVRVTTPDIGPDGALVMVETTVTNDSLRTATPIVGTVIADPSGAVVALGSSPITLLAGESGVVRERLWISSPQLWNVDTPVLYSAKVTADDDATSVDFGVRSLQLDARHGLRINGETVKLRGACIHHDNGVIGARSIARAEERRVELLKAAGFNAIRSSHNPISPELLDACDRLGMLVMDESHDMWAESKTPFDSSTNFAQWWERDLESMVAKDFNHPSVVLYSIGNEIPETGRTHGSRLGRLLAEKIHSLDPSRFSTNGVNGAISVIKEMPAIGDFNDQMIDMGAMMGELVASDLVTARTEESFAALDVAGLNYGDSRYATDATLFPNRVIVGSETFPRDIDRTWALVLAGDNVIGDFTWTGWDYLGEAGIGRVDYVSEGGFPGTSGDFPWLLGWCGDLDITGFRRPASYYREIVFGLRSDPYIAVQRPHADDVYPVAGPWSWPDTVGSWAWPVKGRTPMRVEVYSSSDEVELMLDGESLGCAATGPENRYRTEFVVPYRAGELVAVSRTAGVEIGRHTLHPAGDELLLVASVDRSTIRSTDDDLAFVTIELTDAAGVVRLGSDRLVTVAVAGPATLLGLGSAEPQTAESYLHDEHTTFDGRAQAVIRPTGPGVITVTVTADALTSRVMTILAA